MSFYIFLIIEEGYSAEITAVDGYLDNALVIFDSNNDGISDLGANSLLTPMVGRESS